MAAGSLTHMLQFDFPCQWNGFGVNAFRQICASADGCFLLKSAGAPAPTNGLQHREDITPHTPPVWILGRHSGCLLVMLNLCPEAAPDMLQRRPQICNAIWPVRGAPPSQILGSKHGA